MNKLDLYKKFGNKIQIFRKKQGLTQEDLAEAIDKSVETISNIERGFSSTRISTAYELASALHINITDLFETEEDKDVILKEIINEIKKLSQSDKEKILEIIKILKK